VKRVVIVGRGGAGKSTLAVRLGAITGLPVVELDTYFWQPGLIATSAGRWAAIQRELTQWDAWIMDGDLGPGDVLAVRLKEADTVIVLDFSFTRCAWRTIRRSRERADFWRWVWAYRRRSLPLVMEAIAMHAPEARLHVFRTPRTVDRFTARIRAEAGP
jgi:adenylate kinase family enzyme